VIAETVAAPLEQEINGVEDMLYMSSQATSDGTMLLTITFRLGTDVDNAQVQVQNRVAQALPRLPEDVRRVGVTTKKASPDLLMVVHLTSPDNRYDTVYLRNYATLQVRDVLARLPGMGEVRLFGAGDYSMRVWLDPERISSRGLTAGDVVRAIREQNVQVAAGRDRCRSGALWAPSISSTSRRPAASSTNRSSATSSSRRCRRRCDLFEGRGARRARRGPVLPAQPAEQ
jgi:multidrug efflux pump subunit AcrB